MRIAAILAVSILSLTAAGCTGDARGSEGEQPARASARRDFQVGAFHTVSSTGPYDIVVAVGGAPSVRAEGDREMVEKMEVVVENGVLRIGFVEGTSFRSLLGREPRATLHITVPSLAGANLAGSGDIRIDRVEGQRFAGNLSGSGDIEIGRLQVGEAAFNLEGSGGIRASGTAGRAAVSLAGSGDIELARLEARDLTVALMGSGDVAARATGTAQVSLMGPGDVTVSGPARCRIERHGPGEVRCNA